MALLTSARTCIRPWQEADRAPFAEINADTEVMRYFPTPLTRAESDALIDRFIAKAERDGYSFGALTLLDGTFIGTLGLSIVRFDTDFAPCTEIGWRLSPAFWGQGLATEAARAALAWGFEELGLDAIYSFTAHQNIRSERVMQRIDMVRIGTFDHPNLAKDSPIRQHVLYRAQRHEWKASV